LAERKALRGQKGSGWKLLPPVPNGSHGESLRALRLARRPFFADSSSDVPALWSSRLLPEVSLRVFLSQGPVAVEMLRSPVGFRTERIQLSVSEDALINFVSEDSLLPRVFLREYYSLFADRLMRAAANFIAREQFDNFYPNAIGARIQPFAALQEVSHSGMALSFSETLDFVDGVGLEEIPGEPEGAAVSLLRVLNQKGQASYLITIRNIDLTPGRMQLEGMNRFLIG
jgi:hypothetical protein